VAIAGHNPRMLVIPMHVRDADPRRLAAALEESELAVRILQPGQEFEI
jgi:hypothetical protein